MRYLFSGLLICMFIFPASAQLFNFDTINPDAPYENIFSKKIYGDSLATTFVIWIKKDVALHKHAEHTEQVYILEGTAKMLLGENWFDIKAGDYIIIPKQTPHQVIVNSVIPLKVVSIQSPMFDGTDRILITN